MEQEDILGIIGFMVILMTPAAAKMAQDALQTKESPYTSEIGAGLAVAGKGAQSIGGIGRGIKQEREAVHAMKQQATMTGDAIADKLGRG